MYIFYVLRVFIKHIYYYEEEEGEEWSVPVPVGPYRVVLLYFHTWCVSPLSLYLLRYCFTYTLEMDTYHP